MADTENLVYYRFRRHGSTIGAVTGKLQSFQKGLHPVPVPDGEFDHLSEGTVVSKTQAPQVDSRTVEPPDGSPSRGNGGASEGPFTLGEHSGGGYYVVLMDGQPYEVDGEAVKVGQGPQNAQAEIDALNAEYTE